MLKQLRVRNLRGFQDLRVDRLRRINLVAGRNNTGKSTLLEAILLLASAGDPRHAVNAYVVRSEDVDVTGPASIAETVWMPLFFKLKTNGQILISGRHSQIGDVSLAVTFDRNASTEIVRDKAEAAASEAGAVEPQLVFTYEDSEAGKVTGSARERAKAIAFDRTANGYTASPVAMLKSGRGDIHRDAVHLGRLRKQKRGHLVLDALRAVDTRLQGIEDNASSGAPMIWVDIGLPELLPLPVMGQGLTHVARLVLGATAVQNGVLLVDEIENGLHHSVLPDVWRAVQEIADRFNVQVFATTHSFECVQAAHAVLGSDGFRLHRLDAINGTTQCVTYDDEAIDGAIHHNLEVR